ncbi:hypothetical protein [Pontibacter akesuensis]|uniref:Uncharacterized protein n=1 Tax=Pontibacter akesuensis TaxID=388950 RepID=A0A1I7JB56_9BACT|nr:hypothetical protein [Pontibacter akesuensis]GHA71291.1 hypothetical protein GCM10007389_26010 [Pontibacter akesuensis]SFU82351.1 hypothetical protein SAMN04487941_2664 [Pontibacter akesuensis]
MLYYRSLSKTTRTIAAMLLLMAFMALVMADRFISLFGGMLLGVLLVQFALEVWIFVKHKKSAKP